MPEPWNAHFLVYGDFGSKKSTFAATFPKPMLVFAFDPYGKERPYLRRGKLAGPRHLDDLGTPVQLVHHPSKDEVIVQIEYFHDADPQRPEAFGRFRKRLSTLHHEFDQWRTIVFDSLTYWELIARKWDEYKMNKGAKDGRIHYAASVHDLEEQISGNISAFPMNVILIAHVHETKDEMHGMMIYNPAAPGQYPKKMPCGFSELYRAYVATGKDGENTYLLQTQKSARFNAGTQIPAPDPCPPTYAALWANAE